ncbi:MAG: hypothetical protein HQK96_16675 [Nitrospirae bacterium]|nr:hypothetical protein [Nitrospirota bacterium]
MENIMEGNMPMPMLKAYGYCKEDLMEREPMEIEQEPYLEYLKSIATVYPFLAIMGLRVLAEAVLRKTCEEKKVKLRDKPTLGLLVNELHAADKMGLSGWKDMQVFSEFLNVASHGYKISPDTAKWALEAIPALLKTL